jgi:hypothetical protein
LKGYFVYKEGKVKRFAVMGLIVIMVIIIWTSSQGAENMIYGCYQGRTGLLRIVSDLSKCKKTEIPISWNQAGLQGPQGPTGPQGPQGPQGPTGPSLPLKVYDARNQYIGILVDRMSGLAGLTSVFIPSMSLFFEFINHEDDNGTYCMDQYLYFTESDCSGIPYLIHTLQHQIVCIERDTTDHLWAGDINAVPVRKGILASGHYTNGGWKCSPYAIPSQIFVIPAYEVTTLPFTLPFTLPLRFGFN